MHVSNLEDGLFEQGARGLAVKAPPRPLYLWSLWVNLHRSNRHHRGQRPSQFSVPFRRLVQTRCPR